MRKTPGKMSRGNRRDLAFAVKAHKKNTLRLQGKKPSQQGGTKLRFGAKFQIATIKMVPNKFKKLLLNTVVTLFHFDIFDNAASTNCANIFYTPKKNNRCQFGHFLMEEESFRTQIGNDETETSAT